jgi:hypothetical protein
MSEGSLVWSSSSAKRFSFVERVSEIRLTVHVRDYVFQG